LSVAGSKRRAGLSFRAVGSYDGIGDSQFHAWRAAPPASYRCRHDDERGDLTTLRQPIATVGWSATAVAGAKFLRTHLKAR
jgi:hypothetical protein